MLISPAIPSEKRPELETPESPDSGTCASTDTISDGQLLLSFLSRQEEDAFAQLVSRFGALVFAVAIRSLRDRHAAEDVFQATFFALARDAGKIRSPESVGAWLHGTALRISRKSLARRQPEVPLENVMVSDRDSSLEEISRQFQQHLVDDELQRLPPLYRAPLVLHFLEGKTCEETAAALGTTLGAVRGRIQRGKQELKSRLMRRGIELPAVMLAISMWRPLARAAMTPTLISAATQGGIAIAHGTPFTSACSSEAVHLAAKETTMFTTGKVIASSAVLLSTAALGWFARAEVAGSEISRPTPSRPEISQVETTAADAAAIPIDFAGALSWLAAAGDDSEDSKPQLTLKYDDGKPDGKRSIAGTGEMIQFSLPDASQKLRSLRVHCARYGTPQAPDEDAEITIVSEDGTDVIHTEFVPYATFRRGESRWTTIRFEDPIEVPETFWVILEFNAERTKGVYISFDTSSEGKHSRTGVPGGESEEVNFGGDWMVQAILTKPE